VNLHI